MAFSLNKLKNILNGNRDNQLAGSGSLDPEIGFKLSLHPVSKNLYVTVIGARHLPSLFGLSRAYGYIVKIKLFPGDSKYETTLQESSWPIWNEDFKFQLKQKDAKKTDKIDLQNLVAGHFLSLTIYAILDSPKPEADRRKSAKLTDKNSKLMNDDDSKAKGLFEKTFSSFKTTKSEAITQKSILEKRRTLGAATWNFDSKLFQNDLKNGLIGTPDIWRPINAIASGLSASDSRVSTIQQGVCRRSYWQYAITDNMVCAGRGHRDSCAGDSGGPLLCKDRYKRYVLQGITSFGDGCGKRGKFGIYTKTAGYVTWMYDVMNDKYFDD